MNWLYRDPLRGLSIDKWPYERGDDEIELDFIFKSMLYLPSWILCLLFSEFGIFIFLGLWIGINFLRRNG